MFNYFKLAIIDIHEDRNFSSPTRKCNLETQFEAENEDDTFMDDFPDVESPVKKSPIKRTPDKNNSTLQSIIIIFYIYYYFMK